MWDKDLKFPNTQSYHIIDTLDKRPYARDFPEWRLCRYLPFIDKRGYISGLTMYCYRHSIIGIIAHGQSSNLIGRRLGCPIHLHLYPNERIVSLWLRTADEGQKFTPEPTILVSPISANMHSPY
jgi:hypothetical protein